MHGDMQPLTNGVALLAPTKSLSHTKVLRAALGWMNSAWSIRTGLCLSPEAADGPYIVWMPPANSEKCQKGSVAFGTSDFGAEWIFRGDAHTAYRDPPQSRRTRGPFLRGGAGTDPSVAVNPEVSPAWTLGRDRPLGGGCRKS